MEGGPALARRWAGVPCLLGGYPLCWFSVGPCLRRCPGTAPTLGRSWCLLGFTILCNNVDFWLFRSAYMFFFYYIHFGVTYKPKWAGYYIVNIFILSLDLFVHGTIIKHIQYNTIQYNTIQYNTIQYNTIPYNTIQYNTIQYNTIQYNTIQYNTIQYNKIQYNTIQYNPRNSRVNLILQP